MDFLNTPHKKKSAGLTAMMAILLMVLFFVIGLTYYDPPISYGMEVSFGNLNQGNGNVQPQKKTASKPSELKNESITQKVSIESSKEEIQKQVKEIMTEKKSSVSIPTKENIKQKIQPTIKKEKKNKRIHT
jgi:preprotein translocase subunit SecF